MRFPGQYYQAETGLNYNYFRDYDPQTGRYIESDPIGLYGGSLSTYAYSGNEPTGMFDPTGTLLRITNSNGATDAQFAVAVAYLANSGQYTADLAQLIASPYTYTIAVNPNGVDAYTYQTRTINWNPTSGLDIYGVGIQSPALGLAHETHHAACHDKLGTKAFVKTQKVPSQTIINDEGIEMLLGVSQDEQSATLAEQIVSRQLGGTDPARSNYNQPSGPISVSSPTYHSYAW